MSKVIASVNTTSDSFQDWIDITNELATAFLYTVTANSTGEVTNGKAYVNGSIGSNTVFIGTSNSVQITANVYVANSTATTKIDDFSITSYRSAKYIISVTDNITTNYQATEILVTHDDTNSYITEYARLSTNGTPIATFTANVNTSSSLLRLYGTSVSTNTTYTISRQTIAV